MDKIVKLNIPLLADGDYTEWVFKMLDNLNENAGSPEVKLNSIIQSFLVALTKADREYQKVYDVFLNKNYLDPENRTEMEDALAGYESKIGRMMLHLVHMLTVMELTPFMIQEHYNNIIKEENLSVLQGSHEQFNLGLQIGHWENYIMSEVGWSLRGAFSVVPPADAHVNPDRAFIGNRISGDSVYVMRVKQWDIVAKVMELIGLETKASYNIKAMEIWGAVFNYLNYMGATPIRLYKITFAQYTNIINIMEDNADNK